MANEYLQRIPTAVGNQRVWTWSYWIKKNALGGQVTFYTTQTSTPFLSVLEFMDDDILQIVRNESATVTELRTANKFRDTGSWMNIILAVDTSHPSSQNRVKLYVNGVLQTGHTGAYPSQNYLTAINRVVEHNIGTVKTGGYPNGYPGSFLDSNITDIFFVDGQALTPDIFGYHKEDKGYISAGSTQSTKFLRGQWVPKSPLLIKKSIEKSGGFGTNGFYLPMNDSSNFGADFHCTPNSIIALKGENLIQPRNGAPTTTDSYVSQLRSDPYAANLVLALPFVSGGLSSGFGDYSATIKGSGTTKSIATNGSASISSTAGFYGSSASFNGSNSYLRTSTNISDFQFGTGDFTIETWLWKSANGTNNYDGLVTLGTSGSATDGWFLEASATRGYYFVSANTGIVQHNVSPNTSQWNHLAICRKSGTTTMYLNGVAVSVSTTSYTVPVTATTLDVGSYAVGVGNYWFNGYLQDLRIYKGVAKYTSGFDVPKPYTPVGIASWRAVSDTISNNFAALNSLRTGGYATLDNANLRSTGNTATNSSPALSTFNVKSGKWYWELRADTIYSGGTPRWPSPGVTVLHSNWDPLNAETHIAAYGACIRGTSTGTAEVIGISGKKTVNNVTSTNLTAGDIYMCAMDADNGAIYFGLNGTWYNSGVPTSGISKTGSLFNYTPATDNYELSPTTINYQGSVGSVNFGQNPTFSGNTTAGTYTDANGKGLFKYQPPSGFLALCEDNLPTPAISDPGKYFKTVLYTGDGISGRNITNVGFTPDLVWIKDRNNAAYNHLIHDSVRGSSLALRTSATSIESSGGLLSFNSDGFSLPNSLGLNVSGNNHVAWCWKAGGPAVINTDGTITSTVSVNQTAGFSIVSYTGNGSNPTTVGHGLGKVPKFIIFKRRNSAVNWFVYHGFNSSGAFEGLNTTNAYNGAAALFNQTSPTSMVINLGNTDSNASGGTYIAYCWAEIEGFSKFGSYVGNGNTDGPFVYCGFKPAFVLWKNSSNATGYSWYIADNARSSTNPVGATLASNTTASEDTGWGTGIMDFTSNGFKIRRSVTETNNSGDTFIFAAFAESPFQTANSK